MGLGVYLDAAPGVLAKAIEIQTPTPGFAVQVYVADHIELELPYGSSDAAAARGWQGPVGAERRRPQRRTHPADTVRARRTATTWCG